MKMKLTKNRKAVLEILSSAHSAMSAYDILDQLHARDGKWKPATVYRALNFLIESEYVHRIESEQKFISCGHSKQKHDQHFFICDLCGTVEEAVSTSQALTFLQDLANANHFKLRLPYIELRGTCARCT